MRRLLRGCGWGDNRVVVRTGIVLLCEAWRRETGVYGSVMKVVPWPQRRVLPDRIPALSCFEARWGLAGMHWSTRGVKLLPHVV